MLLEESIKDSLVAFLRKLLLGILVINLGGILVRTPFRIPEAIVKGISGAQLGLVLKIIVIKILPGEITDDIPSEIPEINLYIHHCIVD